MWDRLAYLMILKIYVSMYSRGNLDPLLRMQNILHIRDLHACLRYGWCLIEWDNQLLEFLMKREKWITSLFDLDVLIERDRQGSLKCSDDLPNLIRFYST